MIDLLKKIDAILFSSAKKMTNPVIDDDLGVLIYFATRYKSSGEVEYKKKSLYLFQKFISIFNDYDFSSGVIQGFDGVFWTISYLKKCNIIESSTEYLEEIEVYLIQSIENDIKDNFFEIFYGSIGKIQYFLDENRIKEFKVAELINKLVNSLWHSKKEDDGSVYWIDIKYDENLECVDLGFAHGILSIFQFLLKLKELNFSNDYINPMILGIISMYKKSENEVKGTSFFPDRYSVKNKDFNLINSRLAYCTGDLPICYAFCYAGQVMNDDELTDYSKRIIKVSTPLEVSSSHLRHFQEHDFFDIGFCHGLSSILYLFHQINKYHNDDLMCFKTNYWKQELIRNTKKYIKIKEPIYYPKTFKFRNEEDILNEKNSILSGLCGAALALLAIEYDETEWSSFLGIY